MRIFRSNDQQINDLYDIIESMQKRIATLENKSTLKLSDRIYNNRVAVTRLLQGINYKSLEADNVLTIECNGFEWSLSLKSCGWNRKAKSAAGGKVKGCNSYGMRELVADVKEKSENEK